MILKLTGVELAAVIAGAKASGQSAKGQEVVREALRKSAEECRLRRVMRSVSPTELMTIDYTL